ncbi:hypothetical protein CHLNCDRAFT_144336 [Chlorella variabilis]|uniref:Uncharacterized protein n=1 Tax=Chlorella variabilis TaxID=554065 RepID=E1ZCF8_CHLVA|nr:hypothetical protein CHLNCDRAFT_144336 [Chlorella variabilis]EFN56808.1 hypothetical protein CHLNCDRAFT_144336 [Chlorella variabilis]|eukprot:XP_005848910.1 hypothetical protein CHLNCDRAFT_144336 [Chlorella variabilis]
MAAAAAAAAGSLPPPGTVVRLLRLSGFSILQQLQIEEALLRQAASCWAAGEAGASAPATTHNWFVINDGTPQPSVVLGVSGKAHELVHLAAAAARRVPLIRRFTGGGTGTHGAGLPPPGPPRRRCRCSRAPELLLPSAAAAAMAVVSLGMRRCTMVVDGDTIFTALIMQHQSLPGVEPYPRPVMQYTEHLYRTVFGQHGAFRLRENGKPPQPPLC